MDYFIKTYKTRCKEEFGRYGFKSFRNNHYRVINDIYQSFTLHRSVSGSHCNVIFGIIPLSVEYDLDKTSVHPWRVSDFEDGRPWFTYDRTSNASIEKCIDDMIICVNRYLIPIFEKATDCEAAYFSMIEHDNVFEGNAYEKFCICLKIENYGNAQKYLQEVIKQHKDAFARNREVLGNNMTQEYIQKTEEEISEKQRLLEMIDSMNYDAVQNWLLENEKRNKLNLKIKD